MCAACRRYQTDKGLRIPPAIARGDAGRGGARRPRRTGSGDDALDRSTHARHGPPE